MVTARRTLQFSIRIWSTATPGTFSRAATALSQSTSGANLGTNLCQTITTATANAIAPSGGPPPASGTSSTATTPQPAPWNGASRATSPSPLITEDRRGQSINQPK